MIAPLDLGKPMRWIPVTERLPTRDDADEVGEVVWKSIRGGAFVARWDEDFGVQPLAWHPLTRYIPPEPPKVAGPEEVWVRNIAIESEPTRGWGMWFLRKPTFGGGESLRYVRADLCDRDGPGIVIGYNFDADLARKVKPLTDDEMDSAYAFSDNTDMRSWFRNAMAARGIEVGE